MTDLETWLIIILVLGVIVSNLAVLKYSAKFKMTQFGKGGKKPTSNSDNSDQPDRLSDEEKQTSQSQTNAEKNQTSTPPKKDDDKDSDGFW